MDFTTVRWTDSKGAKCEASYSLPPDEAVVAAYEQFQKKNFQTWMYQNPAEHPQFKRNGRTIRCGKFKAVTKECL